MIDKKQPIELSNSVKERIIECLSTFVQTVYTFYDLFSNDSTIVDQNSTYEVLISDGTFIIESLKDDGIVINKIPSYITSKFFSYFYFLFENIF